MVSKKVLPFPIAGDPSHADALPKEHQDNHPTDVAFPNDPLFDRSFPHAILVLNAHQPVPPHALESFGLTTHAHDGFQFLCAKNPTAKSYGTDVISLFAFVVSLTQNSHLDGFYLGVDSALQINMKNAIKNQNLNAFTEFRERTSLAEPLKKFVLDVFAVNCLARAGFDFAETTLPQTITTAHLFQLRAQFLAAVDPRAATKTSVG